MPAKRRTKRAPSEHEIEIARCSVSSLYFVQRYVLIYDPVAKDWIPFRLWRAQMDVLMLIHTTQKTLFLKPRQVGLTWIALAYTLWQMLFRPIAQTLLFSRREDEALYLLSDERLRGMYAKLPVWLRARAIVDNAAGHFGLSNGSGARAFPSNAGDSYTATLAVIDEADLVPDLNSLLAKVEPTIKAGGKLVLLSRADKSKPDSLFKQIYRAAKAGENDWKCLFLPWHVHPGRDNAWYEAQQRDILRNTGALDVLYEQYPATDTEALAPRTLDKRIAPAWLEQCYVEMSVLSDLPPGAPSIPGLKIYRLPEPGRRYAGGLDPAEGNPTSDDSSMTFCDALTGEEVAHLSGKFQPAVFAAHADAVGRFFNNAALMVERNNHGHAVLLWLEGNSKLKRLSGFDEKEGWLSNSKGKALLYDACADAFREHETILHTFETYIQLASIEGATLRAPEGTMDDRADGYALMIAGAKALLNAPKQRSAVW